MIIRDILYKDIEIESDVIIELISTYEFQRLRKIRQLGLTYLIFPTAEHTRYSHSIGVYYLAQKFVFELENKRGLKFDTKELRSFYIACLLHDIGHGPLSHTTEEIFNLNHEKFSVEIILNSNTEINKVLNKHYDDEFILNVTKFILKTHSNKMLNSLISSSLDIDRMDYLARDSIFAGVVYGQFDVDRILTSIDCVDDRLVYKEKSIRTIEDFLLSRYHMFGQVYLNDKTIGYEYLVKLILKRVKELYVSGFKFKTDISRLVPYFSETIDVIEYIKLNDNVLLDMIEGFAFNETDLELKDMSSAFVHQAAIVSVKSPGKKYLTIHMHEYNKRVYDESIYISMDNGEIKSLEEISQLVKYAKSKLKLTVCQKELYIELL